MLPNTMMLPSQSLWSNMLAICTSAHLRCLGPNDLQGLTSARAWFDTCKWHARRFTIHHLSLWEIVCCVAWAWGELENQQRPRTVADLGAGKLGAEERRFTYQSSIRHDIVDCGGVLTLGLWGVEIVSKVFPGRCSPRRLRRQWCVVCASAAKLHLVWQVLGAQLNWLQLVQGRRNSAKRRQKLSSKKYFTSICNTRVFANCSPQILRLKRSKTLLKRRPRFFQGWSPG